MTPDQMTALTDIALIVSKIGTWPIGSIILVIIFGPYLIMSVQMRSMEKRFDAVMKMYENNARLVECYEKMAKEQADTIRLATAATVELTTYLKQQVPCYQRMREKWTAE